MGRPSHLERRWTYGAVAARRSAVFGMLGVAAVFAEVTYYLRDKDLLPGPEDESPRIVLWRSLDLYPWVVLVLAALLWLMCRRTAARVGDPGSARLPALGGVVIGWGLVLAIGAELNEYARIAHGDEERFLATLILIVSVVAGAAGVFLIGSDRGRPLVMDMGIAGGLFVASWIVTGLAAAGIAVRLLSSYPDPVLIAELARVDRNPELLKPGPINQVLPVIIAVSLIVALVMDMEAGRRFRRSLREAAGNDRRSA